MDTNNEIKNNEKQTPHLVFKASSSLSRDNHCCPFLDIIPETVYAYRNM